MLLAGEGAEDHAAEDAAAEADQEGEVDDNLGSDAEAVPAPAKVCMCHVLL